MTFNLFDRSEFKTFYKRIQRSKKIVVISKKELLIEHYVELRRHLKLIKKLFPSLLKSYEEELEALKSIPESIYRDEMEKFLADLKLKLQIFESHIDNALVLIERILKIRVISQLDKEKNQLSIIIQKIAIIIERVIHHASVLIELDQKRKSDIKHMHKKPIAKIKIVGKLKNGWSLSDIQQVIIDLGGIVLLSGGRHTYRIVFLKTKKRNKAVHPLSRTSPYDELVSFVSVVTGIEKVRLRNSFSKGKLISP